MLTCRCCNGNCDNGELVNGICLECLEEERQRNIRAESVNRMLNSQSYQTKIRLEDMENEKCAL